MNSGRSCFFLKIFITWVLLGINFGEVVISLQICFDINCAPCSGCFIAVSAYEFQVAFFKISMSVGSDIIEKVTFSLNKKFSRKLYSLCFSPSNL